MENSKAKKPSEPAMSRCETCEYYDYDADWDTYVCNMNLDEDEMLRFLDGQNSSCPYYKFYDEYKTVQKQI